LYQTEAVAEGIAAERCRPVLGVLEDLFLLGTGLESSREG
jgi:hypothetical protein